MVRGSSSNGREVQGGGRYVDPAPTSTQAHGCAKVGVGMFGMGAFGREYAEKARKTEGGGLWERFAGAAAPSTCVWDTVCGTSIVLQTISFEHNAGLPCLGVC